MGEKVEKRENKSRRERKEKGGREKRRHVFLGGKKRQTQKKYSKAKKNKRDIFLNLNSVKGRGTSRKRSTKGWIACDDDDGCLVGKRCIL